MAKTKKTTYPNPPRAALARRHNVLTSANDNLSAALSDLVPEWARDTDRFINVVQWNIEWFGAAKSAAKDRKRHGLVVRILSALNADLFVFQEVAGPSRDGRYPGVLDSIAATLTRRGLGDYRVEYTQAGGEQRVAMMWDRDFLRAKDEVADLFPRGTHTIPNGKDAFAGRTPLYGFFETRTSAPGDRFDFQTLGVHLKAMGDGAPQRKKSAEVLSRWMTGPGSQIDADIVILGDFNAPPSDAASWAPFHALENANPSVKFREINDESDFSYLWLANQSSRFVSRIDLSVVALSGEFVPQTLARPIRWKPLEEAIARAGNLQAPAVRQLMRELKERISDHLPTISQFYFRPPER
jgi:endonuclease/exonuclease/phosphatase family metal-dependent hydrolase